MSDAEFLNWIADRFVYVHGESENVDFVQRLRKIATSLGEARVLTVELDEYDGWYGFADENGITVMPDDGRYLVVRIDD